MVKDCSKIKEKFNQKSEYEQIKKELKEVDKILIIQRFNPDVRSLSELHNILDNIQELQARLGRVKVKALAEETLCELCYLDCKDAYDELYDEEFNKIRGSNDFKNVAEKQSYVNNILRNNSIEDYVKYFEKKKIKIKNILRIIDTYIKVVDEMDDKSSRKISLMQLQKELGTLIDVKME